MAIKQVQAILKLQITAGAALPGPPLGPSLGQHGVNIQEFIKQFNDKTAEQKGSIVPVKLTIYKDRSFSFEVGKPLVAYLIKKAIGITKGSATPNTKKVGSISRNQIREIAQLKMEDLNTSDLKKALKIVEGTAHSLGIDVVE
ncbi:MAG: 50S ribosomal protein L11 [Candidatus Paceibacterota bacterium]|jgi:large subunit ribosomal protein L11